MRVEDVVGVPVAPGDERPAVAAAVLGLVGLGLSHALVDRLVPAAQLLQVEVLPERGEALVEPDLRPVPARREVAEPLVRELVRQRDLIGRVGEDRPGLGLERVADRGGPVDDPAGGLERVGAELRAEQAEDVGDLPQHRLAVRMPRVDGDVRGDPLRP